MTTQELIPVRSGSRQRQLFDSLCESGAETISTKTLVAALRAAGLRLDDPRLARAMGKLQLDRRSALPVASEAPGELDFETFESVTNRDFPLIEKALTGELAVPDFEGFRADLIRIFEASMGDAAGKVADYIPQLGRVDPEQFAMAVCTVDGQRFQLGDSSTPFCVQSCCKPILYSLALEEQGEDKVHRHVGREPSGLAFNELTLNHQGLPHNPMINAGAIMSCSLIQPEQTPADRFDHVLNAWQDLAGGVRPGFSNPTYLSERRTADRNFALGYSMRENKAFPDGTDLMETLEFYFQCCSLEVTADSFATVAATLANGGICPTTGKRVFQPDTVRKCLALMSSCGMYDFSGEWAFAVGLPAKSGVSGAIWIVIPNVLGICVWSPRLDRNGNSVRGIRFCRELVRSFNFHAFDTVGDGRDNKRDPRLPKNASRTDNLVSLCWAASKGDLAEVQRLTARGLDLDDADYDGRTALHLAASEGHADVVAYLVGQGVVTAPQDRWGNTPLDDARRAGHRSIIELLSNG